MYLKFIRLMRFNRRAEGETKTEASRKSRKQRWKERQREMLEKYETERNQAI